VLEMWDSTERSPSEEMPGECAGLPGERNGRKQWCRGVAELYVVSLAVRSQGQGLTQVWNGSSLMDVID